MIIDGNKIVEYRAKKHLSQTEFARIVGVSPLTIHRAEQGKCSKTTKTLIELILKSEGETNGIS